MSRLSIKFNQLIVSFWVSVWVFPGMAQEDVLGDSWIQVETENFSILSQISNRQTLRYADQLETWRQVAAYVIGDGTPYPKGPVRNTVYLFDDHESFQEFMRGDETFFFNSATRQNYMALVLDDDESTVLALHHYAHFLIRNFADLRLPRWYEEGLAGYLARIEISRGEAEFQRFPRDYNELMIALSESFSMERLLYRDDALASPRVIQIANLKSSALLHYLLHGHEEDGFIDRRQNLDDYLGYILAGRNHRFAYDQAFDVTVGDLDVEFHNYLLTSSRPAGEIAYGELIDNQSYSSSKIEGGQLAVLLGELALNSGSMATAQSYFEATLELDPQIARGYSGLGDSIRFQGGEVNDQEIAAYFQQAVEAAPEDPVIMLDYGEYWEAELNDCDKPRSAGQRQLILEDMAKSYQQALTLMPENPEANLATAHLYLFEGSDWRQGRAYQEKAFSLFPADTFIMEQAVRYSIEAEDFERAERLISEMAQAIHFYGEPSYVTALRERLMRKRRGEGFDACAAD